jgi:hypothetical protein
LQPLFTKFLETKERVNTDSRDYKAILKRKDVPLPARLTLEAWKQMSLTEQYETVFGSNDPSRRKLRDLPYSVRIVSRKRTLR